MSLTAIILAAAGAIAGFIPGTYQAVYNASKAYLDMLSFALYLIGSIVCIAGLAWIATLLGAAGADVRRLGGCCGLAGNWGVERGHHDVSVAVAEQNLLPALDAARTAIRVHIATGRRIALEAIEGAGGVL